MIAKDFIYCSPKTRREAIRLYRRLKKYNDKVFYYSGGSEIISMARVDSISPDAIIDIKNIPECNVLEINGDHLVIGSAVTLNRIEESGLFPLLGITGSRIADHTNQCKITIGGNICGTIIYKETVLPLLLTDATISIYGPRGMRLLNFSRGFDRGIKLNNGEFVYQIKIDKRMLNLPYAHIKRTSNEKIDYPLVTICSLKYKDRIKFAFSGICSYPFKNERIDDLLNDDEIPLNEKLNMMRTLLPEPPISDYQGSGEYRMFQLSNIIENILEGFKN